MKKKISKNNTYYYKYKQMEAEEEEEAEDTMRDERLKLYTKY